MMGFEFSVADRLQEYIIVNTVFFPLGTPVILIVIGMTDKSPVTVINRKHATGIVFQALNNKDVIVAVSVRCKYVGDRNGTIFNGDFDRIGDALAAGQRK